MTRLEVVDSAIKIGLGAIIGLVSSIAVSLLTASHERKKEVRRRRLDALEKSAVDFESQTSVFLKLFSAYSTVLIMLKQGDAAIPASMAQNPAEAKAALAKTIKERMKSVWDVVNSEVGPALMELHRIEAVLVTVGANEASKLVERYRLAAVDIQSAVVDITFEPERVPTLESFTVFMNKAGTARQSFYSQIQ